MTVRKWAAGVVLGVAVCIAVAMPPSSLSARPPERGYVTSTLALPETPNQANTYARDINGDGHLDNAFGQFLATLASQNLDFQSDTVDAIFGGKLLMLHSLRTPSWKKTTKATWRVLFAKPAVPKFDGTDVLKVNASGPSSLLLRATVRNHRVKTRAGSVPVQLALGDIVTLRLKSGVIAATCSRSRCSQGRITGAITKQELDSHTIPQLAAAFTARVAHDCPGPGPDSCGSEGQILQQLFDTDDDLVISSAELSENSFVQALLSPDLDLNHDGELDALSVGLGFETVRAKLVR